MDLYGKYQADTDLDMWANIGVLIAMAVGLKGLAGALLFLMAHLQLL